MLLLLLLLGDLARQIISEKEEEINNLKEKIKNFNQTPLKQLVQNNNETNNNNNNNKLTDNINEKLSTIEIESNDNNNNNTNFSTPKKTDENKV